MLPETKFLIDVVIDASKLITDDFIVKSKDDGGDLVTNFDFEIERFIIARVLAEYPTYDIISEEFNPKEHLTKNCFVIDPIDGTINFANGIPLWGIQVAKITKGKTVCAVIYLPRVVELYYADETGAYSVKICFGEPLPPIEKHKKISVSKLPPKKALYLVEGGNKFPALAQLNADSRHWRYYCCTAVNYAWTACGRLGGAILRKDQVWDYIPGQFLVRQAGGVIINKTGAHIAANTRDLAKLLLEKGVLK